MNFWSIRPPGWFVRFMGAPALRSIDRYRIYISRAVNNSESFTDFRSVVFTLILLNLRCANNDLNSGKNIPIDKEKNEDPLANTRRDVANLRAESLGE